jgi:hypothetical protein
MVIAAGCSRELMPVEPVTFDDITGRYTLTGVGGKPLPATLGICFLAGCASVGTVTSGTLEISNDIAGKWKASIVTADDQTGEVRTRNYDGLDATVDGQGNVTLTVKDESDPLFARWNGTLRGNVLSLVIVAFTYNFTKGE